MLLCKDKEQSPSRALWMGIQSFKVTLGSWTFFAFKLQQTKMCVRRSLLGARAGRILFRETLKEISAFLLQRARALFEETVRI